MSRFLREPVSVRNALSVIVGATAIVVVAGGVLMWAIDHDEYPTVGRGLWLATQTVTTVGYGDVTPVHPSGRIVAAVVMFWGIAFLAILTAAITSSFVARAARERELGQEKVEKTADRQIDARLDDLAERLDRIEKLLSQPASG
jgi:voltage-gated potassium channel